MKYWIFQSNQVLGPYEPDDLSRHSAFGAESLVCPEGRRGTSMGDWQRAGMVPDLSVALVRAAQAHNGTAAVATLAGLPPEPTLKDLAVLGSLQEKMAMLEDVVLQLQDGLRVKDAELAALHEELAGKDRQSSVMKSAMEREAADLKLETEERKREAEELKSTAEAFKSKMVELEQRVGVVNRLSETIDHAVEAEKHVERDVETQGATISALTKEIESLRVQLNERLSPAAPAPLRATEPPPRSASYPAFGDVVPPSFGAPTPEPAQTMPLDPLSSAAPELPPSPEPVAVVPAPAPAPAASGRKKGLIVGGVLALGAFGALILFSGGKKKASVPADAEPLPTETAPTPVQAASAPAADPREAAIQMAKDWPVPGGRTLGRALETLSPPVGNLTPWMAEPLGNDRVSVNYFAHPGAPGAPTVAYEFQVDLAVKTVVGRNPAAKAAIAGKAAAPPAPPKPRPVKIKPKAKAKPAKVKPVEAPAPAPAQAEMKPVAEAPIEAPSDVPQESAAAPTESTPAPVKPTRPTVAKRAAKAAADSGNKAADEALLDDILKE